MYPTSVLRVYKTLTPKPKELLRPDRQYVREGPIVQYNHKQKKSKQRYFFLFTGALLITKRESKRSFWLKIYINIRPGIKIEDVPDSTYHIPRSEFRIYAPKKSFIFFARNEPEKISWINDIKQCSGGPQQNTKPVSSTLSSYTPDKFTDYSQDEQAGEEEQDIADLSLNDEDYFDADDEENDQFVRKVKPNPAKKAGTLASATSVDARAYSSTSQQHSSPHRGSPLQVYSPSQYPQRSQSPHFAAKPASAVAWVSTSPSEFDDDDDFSVLANRKSVQSTPAVQPISQPAFSMQRTTVVMKPPDPAPSSAAVQPVKVIDVTGMTSSEFGKFAGRGFATMDSGASSSSTGLQPSLYTTPATANPFHTQPSTIQPIYQYPQVTSLQSPANPFQSIVVPQQPTVMYTSSPSIYGTSSIMPSTHSAMSPPPAPQGQRTYSNDPFDL